jgi:O-antigen/teichoic acid export membrane protein
MRVNTTWALAGNAVYAGCQWAVLVILVRTLSAAEVGEYAYALAVTSPIFILANVRLRNLLATGVASDFRAYFTTRLLTTGCAWLVTLAVGAFSTSRPEVFFVIALIASARSCDAVSDICHGLFQRELDMRTAAVGLMMNGIVSVLLVQVALALRPSLPPAAVAYAVGSGVALVAWDLPHVVKMLRTRPERSSAFPWTGAWSLLVQALPLGLSSAVGSIQTNLPRYTIASLLGPAPLAIFAAISHLPLFGHLVVNAASQAALPLLAADARTRRSSYQSRLYGLVAASVGLGSLALLLTAVGGRAALRTIYGPEYAAHSAILLVMMATAVLTFTSVFLGTATTACGRFGTQLAVSTTSLAVVAASLGPLVRRFGLNGAAGALLLGAVVELAAYAVITVRDLRREEPKPTLLPGALAGSVQP